MKIFQVIAVSVFDNEAGVLVRAFSSEGDALDYASILDDYRDIRVIELSLDGDAIEYIV